MHEKTKELCELKCTLLDWVKTETQKGVHSTNAKELGEVIDMIKDLAEAEKCCMEAHYYETVSEAMEDYEENMGEEGRYGYNPMHSSQTGRFISNRGRGRGRSGYDGGSGNSGSRGGNGGNRGGSGDRMGYIEPDMYDDDGYGRHHRDRRWYHEGGEGNMGEALNDLEEMWNNADPEAKRRMKAGMNELLGKMKI